MSPNNEQLLRLVQIWAATEPYLELFEAMGLVLMVPKQWSHCYLRSKYFHFANIYWKSKYFSTAKST